MGLFRRSGKKDAARASDPEIIGMQELMRELMAHGQEFADQYGLGHTREEMAQVEVILTETLQQPLTDDEKQTLHRQVTGYLYGTIITNFPERWFVSHTDDNPAIMVVGEPGNNVQVLGWQKVHGRIENGAEDNLQFFYEGIVDYSQKPGVHTLM